MVKGKDIPPSRLRGTLKEVSGTESVGVESGGTGEDGGGRVM